MKKVLSGFSILALTAVLMGGSLSSAREAYAAEAINSNTISVCEDASIMSIEAEETAWYFRVLDGVTEKRLWSITRGIWLTEWMPA
ncbi:MAG TPA: hypothetical protein VFC58_13560 [Desulfosporosinus sp.]|nr:hypothetical protein [Desulfosporosinus sp.]